MSRTKIKPALAKIAVKRTATKSVAAKPAQAPAAPQKVSMKTNGRTKVMNEQFTRQAQDMFKVAQDGRIPENMKAFAEDSVTKTREAYLKLNTVAKDGAKVVEEVVLAAQAGAKTLGDKVMHNTSANTEALFDAAQAIARARSLPEAARLQADFMQQQFAAASAQTKELFELSTKVARQTMESMNSAATKSFEQFKR